MAFLGFNFNLLEQLAFYGAYHNNRWNQAIHFVFVPTIFLTVVVWLSNTPPLGEYDLAGALAPSLGPIASGFVLNSSVVLVCAYSAYYLILDFFAGLTWAAFVALPLWVAGNLFQQGVPHANWAAFGIHVLSWYMQIHPGHAVLEGRRPALLDSFFQSLVLAPLFVWYELLFLLGYRPALYAELQRRVLADIATYKASRTPLLSADTNSSDAGGEADGQPAFKKHAG